MLLTLGIIGVVAAITEREITIADCSSNQTLVNGACVALSCPAGQKADNHQCVADLTNCSSKTGNTCVAMTNDDCSSNQALVNGKCTTLSCGSKEKIENHACVANYCVLGSYYTNRDSCVCGTWTQGPGGYVCRGY